MYELQNFLIILIFFIFYSFFLNQSISLKLKYHTGCLIGWLYSRWILYWTMLIYLKLWSSFEIILKCLSKMTYTSDRISDCFLSFIGSVVKLLTNLNFFFSTFHVIILFVSFKRSRTLSETLILISFLKANSVNLFKLYSFSKISDSLILDVSYQAKLI